MSISRPAIQAWISGGQTSMADLVGVLLLLSAAFSAYVPIFGVCIHALTHSVKRAFIHRILLWISVVQFLCIASHFVLYLVYAWGCITRELLPAQQRGSQLSTITNSSSDPNRPMSTARTVAALDPIPLSRSILFVIALELADGVFVYRLFHVWGRKWSIIILPILCMLAPPAILIASPSLFFISSWRFGQVTFSVVLNIYITGLISYKVWRNNRGMDFLGWPRINRVIIVLLESAGIYTAFAIVTAISIALSTEPSPNVTLRSGLQVVLAPIIGITYSLMIILVARGRPHDSKDPMTASLNFNPCSQPREAGIESVDNGPIVDCES